MRKIDIYLNGEMVASTVKHRTCRDARQMFIKDCSNANIALMKYNVDARRWVEGFYQRKGDVRCYYGKE